MLGRDSSRSLLKRPNSHRCFFRKCQVHPTGEAAVPQWRQGHRNRIWDFMKSSVKKWTYFFFSSCAYCFLPPPTSFFLSQYCLLNLNPGLNGDWNVTRGTIKIRNFRKKDLMRGLGVLGGGIENYLERNEGKTKLNIRISTMAVDWLVRDTDGLHSPEQKQTGSNRARAPSPLHSSLSGKLEK